MTIVIDADGGVPELRRRPVPPAARGGCDEGMAPFPGAPGIDRSRFGTSDRAAG